METSFLWKLNQKERLVKAANKNLTYRHVTKIVVCAHGTCCALTIQKTKGKVQHEKPWLLLSSTMHQLVFCWFQKEIHPLLRLCPLRNNEMRKKWNEKLWKKFIEKKEVWKISEQNIREQKFPMIRIVGK